MTVPPEETQPSVQSTFDEYQNSANALLEARQGELGFRPTLQLSGALDQLPDNVRAGLNSAINAAMESFAHVHAHEGTISITATHEGTQVVIVDQGGESLAPSPPGSEYRQLEDIARQFGGDANYSSAMGGGNQITLNLPQAAPEV